MGEITKLISSIYRAPSVGFFWVKEKVHRIDEGYTWVPRTRDFIEDPRKEIRKIEVAGFRRLSTGASTLQEVGIFPTLVYFPCMGGLRGCLGVEN